MNRFVKRMNEVNRDLSSPYVRPKDAATLILVDRSGRVPKVLLGKRHQRHKFMSSARWSSSCGGSPRRYRVGSRPMRSPARR